MSWTQSCCDRCWVPFVIASRGQLFDPTRVRTEDIETCAFCGVETTSGIYVRADPQVVPFPRKENDD
jgi:hypothetical protein